MGWWVAHKILVTAQVLGFHLGLDFGLRLVNNNVLSYPSFAQRSGIKWENEGNLACIQNGSNFKMGVPSTR